MFITLWITLFIKKPHFVYNSYLHNITHLILLCCSLTTRFTRHTQKRGEDMTLRFYVTLTTGRVLVYDIPHVDLDNEIDKLNQNPEYVLTYYYKEL